MGLLDDAIRQHLELKRQHGVAEEELRRQEEEALGPARRDVAPAESEEGGEVAAEPEMGEPVAEAEAPAAPELEVHDQETALQEPAAEAPPEPLEAVPAPFDGAGELPVPDTAEPPVGEAPLEPKADHPPLEPVFDPGTRGEPPPGDIESLDDDELLEEPEEGDADVLEDTPDFLQETPEHDRLWFEQKPPRDFDFD